MNQAQRLDVASLEVQSFEIPAQAGFFTTGTGDQVDSRAAGCTEPLRVCSG
ncbi:MAG TPA: hypothetical protein VFS20_31475 [Longimicrobium sp.]|nr:hypothetical protein [Longimicrobium sp.]